MKRGMILFSIAATLAVSARCQTAMIALDDIPGTTPVCVTNYGPQVVSLTAWFAGLQSRTSYWDTAYSWGDWHSAVAQKLDSAATNGWVVGSHAAFLTGEAAAAALATNRVTDLFAEGFVFKIQGGTGTIYSVPVIGTNLTVTLDADFLELTGGTRPAWTNHVFPFEDGLWRGVDKGNYLAIIYNGTTWWMGGNIEFPYNCNPGGSDAQGDAWISVASFVYGTNQTFVKNFAFTDDIPTNTLTLVQLNEWWAAKSVGLATTQSVSAVAGDLDAAMIIQNNHTANGTIGSDGHASSVEKANWNGKLSASDGTASNLTVNGFIALPQIMPTNLVIRLVTSNEHILVKEDYP